MPDDIRYPIGQPALLPQLDPDTRRWRIRALETAPGKLRRLVEALSSHQLDQPLRPGAWTLRQLIHHLADIQVLGYLHFRWALTEDEPACQPYNPEAWAALPDIAQGPIGLSLRMLEGLHARWSFLLLKMDEADFARLTHHPERGPLTLDQLLDFYAWHAEHHIAQIQVTLTQR